MKTYSIVLTHENLDSKRVANGLSLQDANLFVAVKNGSTDETFAKYTDGKVYIVDEETKDEWWSCPVLKPTNWIYVVYEVDDQYQLKDNTTKYYSSFDKVYLAIRKYLDTDKYDVTGAPAVDARDYPDLFGFSSTGLFLSLNHSDVLYFNIDEKEQENKDDNDFSFFAGLKEKLHTRICVTRQELL